MLQEVILFFQNPVDPKSDLMLTTANEPGAFSSASASVPFVCSSKPLRGR